MEKMILEVTKETGNKEEMARELDRIKHKLRHGYTGGNVEPEGRWILSRNEEQEFRDKIATGE